jgi:hypothetical protein
MMKGKSIDTLLVEFSEGEPEKLTRISLYLVLGMFVPHVVTTREFIT